MEWCIPDPFADSPDGIYYLLEIRTLWNEPTYCKSIKLTSLLQVIDHIEHRPDISSLNACVN